MNSGRRLRIKSAMTHPCCHPGLEPGSLAADELRPTIADQVRNDTSRLRRQSSQSSTGEPQMTLQELLAIDLPIIQAPMAGVQGSALAVAVSNAGGLGSLPCAMLAP